MKNSESTHVVFADSKKHYEILDGLRGVAAVMVVMFHIFETFSGGDHTKQIINHGYLAVDFFFLLSGFVIAHAYDDRWNKMTFKQFFTRRLIRLHPMILAGMTIGAILFYFSASPVLFPPISQMALWKVLVIMCIGYFLIPVPVSMDIRGWQEMYPLNGPAWSLFFEYIGNILYAFVLRRTSTKILSVLVLLSGVLLFHYTVTSHNGDIIGGWSITSEQLQIGFTRLLYPFLAGLLLHRLFNPVKIKYAFVWCSLFIIAVLLIPRIGDATDVWKNGIYDAIAILFIFPLIVFFGASGSVKSKIGNKVCTFFGDISYPIYIVHYPIIYIFSAWVVDNKVSLNEAIPMGLVVLVSSVALAYAALKLYDIPARKWLTQRWIAVKS